MKITVKSKGDFRRTETHLSGLLNKNYISIIEPYAREGVAALSSNTPIDSGQTANAWGYKIERRGKKGFSISWTNTHVVDGVPIAVILQYGHGTGWGGYVEGRDYINPAMGPIFDKIVTRLVEEVTNS